MMSRKHYKPIAAILAQLKSSCEERSFETAVSEFCRVFKLDNPNFDTSRFCAAVYKNLK